MNEGIRHIKLTVIEIIGICLSQEAMEFAPVDVRPW